MPKYGVVEYINEEWSDRLGKAYWMVGLEDGSEFTCWDTRSGNLNAGDKIKFDVSDKGNMLRPEVNDGTPSQRPSGGGGSRGNASQGNRPASSNRGGGNTGGKPGGATSGGAAKRPATRTTEDKSRSFALAYAKDLVIAKGGGSDLNTLAADILRIAATFQGWLENKPVDKLGKAVTAKPAPMTTQEDDFPPEIMDDDDVL